MRRKATASFQEEGLTLTDNQDRGRVSPSGPPGHKQHAAGTPSLNGREICRVRRRTMLAVSETSVHGFQADMSICQGASSTTIETPFGLYYQPFLVLHKQHAAGTTSLNGREIYWVRRRTMLTDSETSVHVFWKALRLSSYTSYLALLVGE